MTVRDFTIKRHNYSFFLQKLKGYKGKQFIEWLEKIGSDPDISDRYNHYIAFISGGCTINCLNLQKI